MNKLTPQDVYDLSVKAIARCESRLKWANDFLNSNNPVNQYAILMPSEISIDLLKQIETDPDRFNFSGDCLTCEWFPLRVARVNAGSINQQKVYDKKCRVVSKIELAKMVLKHEQYSLDNQIILRDSLKKQLDSSTESDQ